MGLKKNQHSRGNAMTLGRSWYSTTGQRQYDGCRCPGAMQAPGHQYLFTKVLVIQISRTAIKRTRWFRITPLPLILHIYASVNRASIGSDYGLSPMRRQAIIWNNTGLLSVEPLATNFSEILIKMQNFSSTKMHLKMSSAKWRPFCPGGDEINGGLIFSYRLRFVPFTC